MLIFDSATPRETADGLDRRILTIEEETMLLRSQHRAKRQRAKTELVGHLKTIRNRWAYRLLTTVAAITGISGAAFAGLSGLDPALVVPFLLISGGSLGMGLGNICRPGSKEEFELAVHERYRLTLALASGGYWEPTVDYSLPPGHRSPEAVL